MVKRGGKVHVAPEHGEAVARDVPTPCRDHAYPNSGGKRKATMNGRVKKLKLVG